MIVACVQCPEYEKTCNGEKYSTCNILSLCRNCAKYPCLLGNCTGANGSCNQHIKK